MIRKGHEMHDQEIVLVSIDEIDAKLRPASDMRAKLDDEAIAQYAESIDDMPPVQLAFDPSARIHWVIDGAHTISGAKRAGRRQIQAIVVRASRIEAFRSASRCNGANGVRITNADKRHRVKVALADQEMAKWSQHRIAEWCGVSQRFVSELDGRSTENNSQSAKKAVGRDGIARKRPARPEPRQAPPYRPPLATPPPAPTVLTPAPAPTRHIDPPEPPDIPEENAPADIETDESEEIMPPPEPSDSEAGRAAYLERFPIRDRVCTRRFDDDALVYRLIAPHLEAIRKELREVVGVRSIHVMGRVHRAVHDLLQFSSPERWYPCEKCGGLGQKDGPCRSCKECGYVIPISPASGA